MTQDFDITIVGLKEARAVVASVQGASLHEAMVRGGLRAMEKAHSLITQEPGPPSHPIKWKSEKQRRWYFASRRGKSPEYRRSGELSRSWRVEEVDATTAGLRTPCKFAGFVQVRESQQPFLKKWPTVEDVMEQINAEEAIGDEIDATMEAAA